MYLCEHLHLMYFSLGIKITPPDWWDGHFLETCTYVYPYIKFVFGFYHLHFGVVTFCFEKNLVLFVLFLYLMYLYLICLGKKP